MPKVQSPKVKGRICNIPISKTDNNFKSLQDLQIVMGYCFKIEKESRV